jgi:hypothetical protein
MCRGKAVPECADNTFGCVLRRLLFMARNKVSASKSQRDDDLVEDDFDGDDDTSYDAIDSIKPSDRLITRRRLEDYFEEKRLREQLGDDYF